MNHTVYKGRNCNRVLTVIWPMWVYNYNVYIQVFRFISTPLSTFWQVTFSFSLFDHYGIWSPSLNPISIMWVWRTIKLPMMITSLKQPPLLERIFQRIPNRNFCKVVDTSAFDAFKGRLFRQRDMASLWWLPKDSKTHSTYK